MMGTTASPLLTPIAVEPESASFRLSAQALSRRARQRRQTQGMIAASWLVDAFILLLYAHAGVISTSIPRAYAATGLSSVVFFLTLSEIGFTERFKDHYFALPQICFGAATMLVFAYLAPATGGVFLCLLFLVFSFGALRATPRQSAIAWTVMTLGLAGLILLTDKPIGLPLSTPLERFAALLTFALTIGRCMFLGMYSRSIRESLYQNGQKLKEAYRRIEELAELDELTGSFNRRCIMRLLEEEIARSHRLNALCSIALIDLDFFKRINDVYGHPIGDEVLRTFAITTFANIRAIDRFGRYGGEEFLLVMPDTTPQSARQTLERLRSIIGELDWSAFSSGLRLTMSAGVVTLRQNEGADAFLARADRALYSAKAQGRDRIASA
jgi:diguanylate cyclase